MATGNFESWIEINDETFPVSVHWEGYYESARGMGGPWEDSSPAESEMNIEKVEFIGDWPEGLSKEEFDSVCQEAEDRLIEAAWDDHDAQSEGDF